MQSDPDHQLRCSAYHEAGHAVVAFLLGRWIARVTIVPGNLYMRELGENGDVAYLGLSDQTEGHSYEEALISMAGPTAQKQFGDDPGWWKDTPDYVLIENSLEEFKGKGFKSVNRYAEKIVELMVRQHWKLITAFAERLLVVKEMDGYYAREFLVNAHQELIREAHFPPQPILDGLEAYAKWMEEHKDKLHDLEKLEKHWRKSRS